jgi:hypothetical protein
MKIGRHKGMYKVRIKIVIILSIFGFLLGAMSIALHHHDNAFLLPNCSICQAKTSLSGAFSKVNVDSATTMTFLSLIAISLSLSGIIPDRQSLFVDFPTAYTYPNKASPF